MVPAVFLVGALLIYPLYTGIAISTQHAATFTSTGANFVGLENYRRFIHDPQAFELIVHTYVACHRRRHSKLPLGPCRSVAVESVATIGGLARTVALLPFVISAPVAIGALGSHARSAKRPPGDVRPSRRKFVDQSVDGLADLARDQRLGVLPLLHDPVVGRLTTHPNRTLRGSPRGRGRSSWAVHARHVAGTCPSDRSCLPLALHRRLPGFQSCLHRDWRRPVDEDATLPTFAYSTAFGSGTSIGYAAAITMISAMLMVVTIALRRCPVSHCSGRVTEYGGLEHIWRYSRQLSQRSGESEFRRSGSRETVLPWEGSGGKAGLALGSLAFIVFALIPLMVPAQPVVRRKHAERRTIETVATHADAWQLFKSTGRPSTLVECRRDAAATGCQLHQQRHRQCGSNRPRFVRRSLGGLRPRTMEVAGHDRRDHALHRDPVDPRHHPAVSALPTARRAPFAGQPYGSDPGHGNARPADDGLVLPGLLSPGCRPSWRKQRPSTAPARFAFSFKWSCPTLEPGIAAIAAFTVIGTWNEFLLALTFVSSASKRTFPPALQQYTSGYQFYAAHTAGQQAVYVLIPVLMSALLLGVTGRHFTAAYQSGGMQGVTRNTARVDPLFLARRARSRSSFLSWAWHRMT